MSYINTRRARSAPECDVSWMSKGIDLPMRDTMQDVAAFRELVMGGGRATVPCLRIEQDDAASSSSASREHVRWLYESAAIIDYLAERRVASDKS